MSITSIKKHLSLLIFTIFYTPLYLNADYLKPENINLINPPLDSVQKTILDGYPVIIHRRTEEQIKSLQELFNNTPSSKKRFFAYQSIARSRGNGFASAIREFTERYISDQNVYMSELPEFGIYSQVSPILGCAVFKDEEGFIDPCNNIRFDLAGKVKDHKGYDHLRLTIPPHKIVNNQLIFIDEYKAKKIIDFTPDILAMNVSQVEKAIFAVDWERLDILKEIIEQSPEVIVQSNSAGSTVLHLSASHETTLDYLLNFKDIQINQINDAGYSPLLFAVWMERYEGAEKLVKHGAEIDSYSMKGITVPSVFEFLTKDQMRSEEFAAEIVQRLRKAKLESKKL